MKRGMAWVVVAGGALIGCGPKVYFKGGEALLKGETPPAAEVPDSLRASIELTGFQGPRKTTVSAAFSAIPGRKYRMDVYGLPGMVEASFHWADTGWTLLLYGREGYLRGYGDTVDLPALGVGKVPVHDLFACLWGDFFPGDGGSGPAGGPSGAEKSRGDTDTGSSPAGTGHPGGPGGIPENASLAGDPARAGTGGGTSGGTGGGFVAVYPARWEGSAGRVRYSGDGVGWTAKVEPKTGLVREAVREDSAFRIRYEEYGLRNGRPLPGRVKVFGGNRPLLEIAVKAVEDNPAWKRDPFLLKIPEGFVRLRPARGG